MITPNTMVPLQTADAIEQTIANVIGYLPTVVAVLVILLVGYILGRILGGRSG